ncbi:hypothetical protein B0H10DRAFT_1948143 [Mycena sp. CBHHK59/15]|nr:hypothetical protein B0H10DRAFT_1948143 [Mycena sp. CBHHK59/15]
MCNPVKINNGLSTAPVNVTDNLKVLVLDFNVNLEYQSQWQYGQLRKEEVRLGCFAHQCSLSPAARTPAPAGVAHKLLRPVLPTHGQHLRYDAACTKMLHTLARRLSTSIPSCVTLRRPTEGSARVPCRQGCPQPHAHLHQPSDDLFAAEADPGATVQTDEQIMDYIKNHGGTEYYTIGTAAMLPREKGGVV